VELIFFKRLKWNQKSFWRTCRLIKPNEVYVAVSLGWYWWPKQIKLVITLGGPVKHYCLGIFLFPPEYFPHPQNFCFALQPKFRNMFFEVFLVQNWQNFGKHIPKFVFKAKKLRKTRFEVFIQGEKRISEGGGKRKIHCLVIFFIFLLHLPRCLSKKKNCQVIS
jgi:hypothetical protein